MHTPNHLHIIASLFVAGAALAALPLTAQTAAKGHPVVATGCVGADPLPDASQQALIPKQEISHVGDDLLVKFTIDLSSVRVSKSESAVYTPLIVRGDSVRALPQLIVNGKKRDILYRRLHRHVTEFAIKRDGKRPQRYNYGVTTPWADWMSGSRVVLVNDYCGCGWQNLGEASRTPLALIDPVFPLAFIKPAASVKNYALSGSAFLDFPVDRTEIHPDYRKNPTELQKILETVNTVKNDPNATISSITIHGYASPESPYAHNDWLAKGRAEALRSYVAALLNIPRSVFHIETTPEDWAGLRRRLVASDLKDRDAILKVVDGDLPPDPKEWKIKSTWPEEYAYMLREWYPALRHSDYTVAYTVRSFSVEEAKALLKTKPAQLSLNEFYLIAQTYPEGSKEFDEVFDIAVRIYPNEPVANLNAGNTALLAGQLDQAKAYLAKAGDSAEARHARAILAAKSGDFTTARRELTALKDKLPASAAALSILDEMGK